MTEVSKLPLVPKHFELGKHMAKLTVDDADKAIILLRPRYQTSQTQLGKLISGIERWRLANNLKTRILVVPHDYDVFVHEVTGDEGLEEKQEDEE